MTLPAIIGIHIGQGHNNIAFADVSFNGLSYNVLNISRHSPELSYPEIQSIIIKKLDFLTMDGDHEVKVRINATCIGTPVTNLLRRNITSIEDVYLTGGYKAVKKEDGLMLPKELMISHLKVLFRMDRISGSFDKPEQLMNRFEKQRYDLFMGLKREVLEYETKVHVDVAHWNPAERTGEHDDLAIALGLACWS